VSRETDALIQYVQAKVPNAVVTATLGHYISADNPCSPHSRNSLHCADATGGKGLAVDWGGDETLQAAVFRALEPVADQLAELIHNGSGIGRAVKNGVWVSPLVVYGTEVWAAHTNHTHSAVPKGTFLAVPAPAPSTPKVAPMYNPPLTLEPIVADLSCPNGGVWLLAASGAVYAFGGAPFLGTPEGKPYFTGRKAAQLKLVDSKYMVVAESGETYGPGFG
jgi:hypothetical protein